MSAAAPPTSKKEQLIEQSEESEYETISQDEGFGSPTVTPYTIDDDFSLSSHHPTKRARPDEKHTDIRSFQQSTSTSSAPLFRETPQENVIKEKGPEKNQAGASASPSSAAIGSGFPSAPSAQSTTQKGENRQDDQGSFPKFIDLSQNINGFFPNNQQAAMSTQELLSRKSTTTTTTTTPPTTR
ncbi:hypothetical protein G6F42_020755 [Rhizopus arrhizus]|nr:hypothetical protein G6F42_020755 [Rhizopus arrhizus]